MALLVIDIGNTRLKWGLYEQPGIMQMPLAHGAAFIERIEELGDNDWRDLPEPTRILGCCVAAEAAKAHVNEQLERWQTPPVWVTVRKQQCGVTNGYDHPTRLGIDRWMALIGARQRLLAQDLRAPAIVVMIGTAVTIDAMDAQGQFLGGLIMPGYGIMMSALKTGTAGLHVPTGDVRCFPTNTSDALSTGGTYAIAGAIERMTHNLFEHSHMQPRVILTGGAAWKVSPYLQGRFSLVESLIFDGLLCVASELQDTSAESVTSA